MRSAAAQVKPGQAVDTVDALSGYHFRGRVESIAPATGSTFSAIAADNATGNDTKVVQRLPVKMVLEAKQPDRARLRVGVSVISQIEVK